MAQPVRAGRPVPADSLFRAVIRRAGVSRDKQLHVAIVLRPPNADHQSRGYVFNPMSCCNVWKTKSELSIR